MPLRAKKPEAIQKPVPITVGGAFAIVVLTQNKYAKIDVADWENVCDNRWCASRCGSKWYAVRTIRKGGRKFTIAMHRVIAGGETREIDHWNGDGLDNRRRNLRRCTVSQNRGNTRVPPRSRSGYKGVTWHHRAGKWMAQIGQMGKVRFLGYFANPIDAAKAYDDAAERHFGHFACLNFPERKAVQPCP